jgi:hypothetical protein
VIGVNRPNQAGRTPRGDDAIAVRCDDDPVASARPRARPDGDGTARCPECGAPGTPRSCTDLFEVLLALDHSRRPPWGPLHAVSVSCYLLQHPGGTSTGVAQRRAVLRAYLDGGVAAVENLTEGARRRNTHRSGAAVRLGGDPDPAPPSGPFAVTIVDVAQGGDFPAAGFEERVRAWAAAILDTQPQGPRA